MKKRIVSVLLAVVILSISPSKAYAAQAAGIVSQYTEIPVCATHGCSHGFIYDNTRYYNMLPQSVKNLLLRNGVQITLMTPQEAMDIGIDPNHYNGLSYTPVFEWTGTQWVQQKQGSIYILESPDSKTVPPIPTLLHEVGHMVDFCYRDGFAESGTFANLSDGDQWHMLYNAYYSEIQHFGPSCATNSYNTSEAFAESFAYTLTNPNVVKKTAPDLYHFMIAVMLSC